MERPFCGKGGALRHLWRILICLVHINPYAKFGHHRAIFGRVMPLLRQLRQKWRTAAFVANIEFVCPISTCMSNLVTIGPYLADLCHFYAECGKSGALRHLWLTLSLCALYLPVCQIWSSSDHIWPSYATFTFFGFSRIRTRDP